MPHSVMVGQRAAQHINQDFRIAISVHIETSATTDAPDRINRQMETVPAFQPSEVRISPLRGLRKKITFFLYIFELI